MKETANYAGRLKALKEEQQRLERKQSELLEKRRAEIGRLVACNGRNGINVDAV
jgi:hypothetical protein